MCSNKNIDIQRERRSKLKETTIVGLPSRVSLDDIIKRGNKNHTLGEFIMDSKEARTQENGEHNPFRIIEHVHIQYNGEEAEMVIIGRVCNTNRIEKY